MRYVPICVDSRDAASSLITDLKTSGDHDYSLPFGLLKDQTNKGPIWDVTNNFRGFWYTPSSGALSSAAGAGSGGLAQPAEGPSWLNFGGLWGDKQWPTDRFGQYCIADECHISDGPTGKRAISVDPSWRATNTHPVHPIGPLSKNLGRTVPCQDESSCTIITSL